MRKISLIFILFLFGIMSCQNSSDGKANPSDSKVTADKGESTSTGIRGDLYADFQDELGDEDIVGPMVIEGNFKGTQYNGRYVMLYETEGKDIFKKDSAKVNGKQFVFNISEAHVGLHRIGILPDERSLGQLIVNPNEKKIILNYSSASFVKGVTYENSKENEGLIAYQKEKKIFDAAVGAVRKSDEEKDIKFQKLYAAQLAFKDKQNEVAKQFPGTFISKMSGYMQSPNKFDKDKFWDDLDFKDATLIHSRVYGNRINDYMSKHAKKENTKENPDLGYYNAVDLIAQKVKEGGNDRVLEFMLYTISEGMYSSGVPDVSLYVIENYFYGDACGDADISELFKEKAAGIRKLQVGNEPPTFNMKDSKDKNVSSKSVIEKNKYTLIFFWASYCHNCEAEVPLLRTSYEEFSDKGFEVIGVSVDLQKNAWTKAISENELKWINVADMQGWKGSTTRDYRVSKTPMMFLINDKNHLVLKTKKAADVHRFLAKRLK